MIEAKLRKQAQRGKQAQDVLENELVKEAFERIERALYESWQRSDPTDEDGRERIYLSNTMLKRFRNCFEQMVREGDFSEKELLRIKNPNAWAKMMEKINV